MSSVGSSGGSSGADSASRAESARAESARADAARQAEASRKATEQAAQAQAAKNAAVRNQFSVDSFTPAAAAKAPVNLNPSPVSATVAQAQTVDATRQVDAAQEAQDTREAEAAQHAEAAQEAQTVEAADEAEAAQAAEAAQVAQAVQDAQATDAQAADAAQPADAAQAADAAQQAQTPTVTEADIEAAKAELPDVELTRNAAGTDPSVEVTAQNQQVQTALHELGLVASAHVTGFYGSITEGAIKSFQYEQGMTVTGNYDAATRDAMAAEIAERRAAEAQGIAAPAVELPDTYTAVTDQQLADIMPSATDALREQYLGPLNDAMEEFNISTPERQAAFLSQIAAETADLQYMSEISPNPEHGDYYGRGMLQLTHEDNYVEAGNALGTYLTTNPDQVATDADLAARTGAWYFNDRGLNQQADQGRIGAVTLGVNGGYNGVDRRIEAYDTALDVLRQQAQAQ